MIFYPKIFFLAGIYFAYGDYQTSHESDNLRANEGYPPPLEVDAVHSSTTIKHRNGVNSIDQRDE